MTGSGVVTGGWEYVWAAYGVTLTVLGAYAATVLVRFRAERARRRAPGGET